MFLIGITTFADLPGRMVRLFDSVAMDVPTTPGTVDAVTLIGVTPFDGTLPLLVIVNVTDPPFTGESLTSAVGNFVLSVSVNVVNGDDTTTGVLLIAVKLLPA